MSIALDQLEKTSIYNTTGNATEIVEDIGSVNEIDKKAEKKVKLYNTLTIVFFIIGMLATFLSEEIPNAFVIGIPLLILALVFFFMRRSAGKLDFEDYRYEICQELVRLVSSDMGSDEPISVDMKLKEVKGLKPINETTRAGWSIKSYHEPWLTLEGKLLDGTKFNIGVLEKLELREKWKRKKANKIKKKKSQKISVRLRFKEGKYSELNTIKPEHMGQAIQLPEGFMAGEFNSTGTEVRLSVSSPTWKALFPPYGEGIVDLSGPMAQATAMMFLSIYQVLNLAKEMGRAKQA